jgi:hypothetical protein
MLAAAFQQQTVLRLKRLELVFEVLSQQPGENSLRIAVGLDIFSWLGFTCLQVDNRLQDRDENRQRNETPQLHAAVDEG